MKKKFECFALILLSACTASGPAYDKAAKYDVIVYRPSSVMGAAHSASVELNGKPFCDLNVGGFATAKIKGEINLTASTWAQPGTSRISTRSPAYIKVEQRSTPAAMFGLPGMLAAEGVNNNGPFEFTSVTPEAAKLDLQDLHQQCAIGN